MTPPLDRPQPLRGPLGHREVLFITRRSSPMLGLLPRGFWDIALPVLGALGIGALLWWVLSRISWHDVEGILWGFALPGWWLTEAGLGAAGARLAGSELRRWQRLRRLPEITLTLLRPVTIGQIMLARPLRGVILFLAATYLAFFAALLRHHLAQVGALVLYGLIAVHGLFTLHIGAWAQLAIALGTRTGLRAFVAMSNLAGVHMLLLFPFVLFVVQGTIFGGVFFTDMRDFPFTVFLVVVSIASVPLLAVKFLLARAFAARLEQVVFPQLAFDVTETGRVGE